MKKIIVTSVLSAVLCCVALFFILKVSDKNKIGWININKVYNDFSFKKELENKLTKTEQARKSILDSAEVELRVLSRQIREENGKDKSKLAIFEMKQEKYLDKKKEFENDNAVMQKQYNNQILTQINQYLKDYGKEYSYSYILGADGAGGLMYAIEKDDITESVLTYINEKYKGK